MNDIDPVWTYEPTEEIAELRALMFDAIETSRQWKTIAREAKNAVAAFRDLAARTPIPTDGGD